MHSEEKKLTIPRENEVLVQELDDEETPKCKEEVEKDRQFEMQTVKRGKRARECEGKSEKNKLNRS